MTTLERLAGLAGTWTSTYQLRGDPSFDGDSPSTAAVSSMIGGRFVRIDYTWSDRGTPQEGSLIVGHELDGGAVTVAWLDSWHNGSRMMICTGRLRPDGGIDVRGSYGEASMPEPWGWHTVLEVAGSDAWTMTMYNVTPAGEEQLAVRAEYRRA